MSPLPHLHASGNMWAAGCNYVVKLMNPQDMGEKMSLMFSAHDEGSMCFGAESDFEKKQGVAPQFEYKK
eukprot:12434992-Ditylum_brightwellii.AAC.1